MINLDDWPSDDLANQHRTISKHMNEIHVLVEALNGGYSEMETDYFTDDLHEIQNEIILALGRRKINGEHEKVKNKDQQENQ